jgi:predicted dehydrogenase
MLTNWAVHHIDIILWAMNSYSPTAVSCSGGKLVVDDLADTPDTIEASWEFAGPNGPWMMQYSYRGFNNFHKYAARPNHHGICFQGTKASLLLDRHGYEIWEESGSKKVGEKVEGVPYFSAKEPNRQVASSAGTRRRKRCWATWKPHSSCYGHGAAALSCRRHSA